MWPNSRDILVVTGGISAIRGFDYQATVILDRLFDHFEAHGATATARPEDLLDDLHLVWEADGKTRRQFVQIKKPREDADTNRKPEAWTLGQVAEELLPNTIRNLRSNEHTQVWILGDSLGCDLQAVVEAGARAPELATTTYWGITHAMMRSQILKGATEDARRKLGQWRIPNGLPPDPATALVCLADAFEAALNAQGLGPAVVAYRQALSKLHAVLPDVLARLTVSSNYGLESEVQARVYSRLQQEFGLGASVIENTIFRNLRGFINDISKQPERYFDRAELEVELRSVWPHMTPVRTPPPLAPDHVWRPDLLDQLVPADGARMVEATGISGSGKTSLATELVEQIRVTDPELLVCYVEVRPDVSLRDVLVGVAFQLRRYGHGRAFALAVESGAATVAVLDRVARAFGEHSRPLLLILDCVEGRTGTGFAHDLADLVRKQSLARCRMVVLAQERVLSGLSPAEQQANGIIHLDIRGLRFEEFERVASFHGHSNRGALRHVFQRLTGGRSGGLSPQFAQAVSRAGSTSEMEEIASRPPEDMLADAERRRFSQVSAASRTAAERLVCFALPFRRRDAEEIFPEENIGAAIRELQALGLIRPNETDFEMHETVRAGLEMMIAVNVRRSAHAALADWYSLHELLSAQLYHLAKAGEESRAENLAREAFLRGENWEILAAYVTSRRLVSSQEVVCALSAVIASEQIWQLPDILRELGDKSVVVDLLRHVRSEGTVLLSNHRRASPIFETILSFEPQRLQDLIQFILAAGGDLYSQEEALTWLALAKRRTQQRRLDNATLAFIKCQPVEVRRMLAPLLWLDGHRDALAEAFMLFAAPASSGRLRLTSPKAFLSLDSAPDVVEFLAAIPPASSELMNARRSVLLGALAEPIWSLRERLSPHCTALANAPEQEDRVRANALRILIYLADPSVAQLCAAMLGKPGEAGEVAAAAPIVAPVQFDTSPFEALLLDPQAPCDARMAAASTLLALGCSPEALRARINAIDADPLSATTWDAWFLLLCLKAPFAGAMPLLETALMTAGPAEVSVLLAVLNSISELPDRGITGSLARLLSHTSPQVRGAAADFLARRRAKTALPRLVEQLSIEVVPAVVGCLSAAIVACGSTALADLQTTVQSEKAQLWRCILAARARDLQAAPELIRVACDRGKPWQLRRAAILAAGYLPYEAGLDHIAQVVLAEKSSLPDDGDHLQLHHGLIGLVSNGVLAIVSGASDQRGFETFIAEMLGAFWSDQPLPPGTALRGAAWLFDRLTVLGWPPHEQATAIVQGELARPLFHSSVLRALSRAGKAGLIEKQLAATDSVWLASKCVLRRASFGDEGPALQAHLRLLISNSPCAGNALLMRIVDDVAVAPLCSMSQRMIAPTPALRSITEVSAEDAARCFRGAKLGLPTDASLRIIGLTAETCERLILLADPALDPESSETSYLPGIELTGSGNAVARTITRYVSHTQDERDRLRSAIAAANCWSLLMPWHEALVRGPLSDTYIERWLDSLGALENSGRFYAELTRAEQILMPKLCQSQGVGRVVEYLDERIIPSLMRYISAGTDEMLKGLCQLAQRVNGEAIDPVLFGLLARWTGRFAPEAGVAVQHRDNTPLWQSLRLLSKHPRFECIPQWRLKLELVLRARLQPFHEEDVVTVLARSPASYILVEERLANMMDWIDFNLDRMDALKQTAEHLFSHLLET